MFARMSLRSHVTAVSEGGVVYGLSTRPTASSARTRRVGARSARTGRARALVPTNPRRARHRPPDELADPRPPPRQLPETTQAVAALVSHQQRSPARTAWERACPRPTMRHGPVHEIAKSLLLR